MSSSIRCYVQVEHSAPGKDPILDERVRRGVAGWLARDVTPIVCVTPTAQPYGDFVGDLPARVILGLKVGNLLTRIDDRLGWTKVGNFIRSVATQNEQRVRPFFLEMETLLETSYWGHTPINRAMLIEGLQQLPRNVPSMAYAVFFETDAVHSPRRAQEQLDLAAAFRTALPYCRMCDLKLSKPPLDNDWWSAAADERAARYNVRSAPALSMLYVSESWSPVTHPYWPTADLPRALNDARNLRRDVCFVPSLALFDSEPLMDAFARAMSPASN